MIRVTAEIMPETADGYLITPEELATWIVRNDDDVLVVNKPALVVCHPSKNGPWSSLAGACREFLGLERIHLAFRLDRETSGVIVLAKHRAMASRLQTAVQERRTTKRYLVIVEGEVREAVRVDAPIGPDLTSAVVARRRAGPAPEAQPALTFFRPLAAGGGFSVLEAEPVTGRTHQIRVHAEWMGHRVVGDKIYGPSPACFLEFIETGWTPHLERRLLLKRQALHCLQVTFHLPGGAVEVFSAPPTADLVAFARERMGIDLPALLEPTRGGDGRAGEPDGGR